MRVYLDVCCLNRPFDDQAQPRIRLEADAVEVILELCSLGIHEWVTSPAMVVEVARNPDPVRRALVLDLIGAASERMIITPPCENLARSLASAGQSPMDALHLAAAQYGRCEVYLTTDDHLIKAARRAGDKVSVRVLNPAEWLLEITNR